MLGPILNELTRMGHEVAVQLGIPNTRKPADLAIMHVDLTVVPKFYLEFGAQYPRCLNLKTWSIGKRDISGALIDQDTTWSGPVIVKSNWNCGGIPEMRLNALARSSQMTAPFLEVKGLDQYQIFESIRSVPKDVLQNPLLVTERFIPEREGDEYAVRFWAFAGDEDRCTRVFSKSPIVKASSLTRFEYCDVPDKLRLRRKELGFDYGKFDFVMHEGEPVLIDANRTPGSPPAPKEATWPRDFANAIIKCIA
jgi:hypothetical protein